MLRSAAYLAFFCVMTVGGCSPRAASPSRRQESPPLDVLPIEMTVRQRSTTTAPRTGGRLRLTIDDITRGQVVASLADGDGHAVLAATSLAPGDSASFNLDGWRYRLTLRALNNALIGDDVATLVISSEDAGAGGQGATIEELLKLVESADRLVFIRNGAEHTPHEAAAHLRAKWQAAGDRIATAQQFIAEIASQSSVSGDPYRVRLPDGTEALAAEFLKEQLRKIETSR